MQWQKQKKKNQEPKKTIQRVKRSTMTEHAIVRGAPRTISFSEACEGKIAHGSWTWQAT
jgi:hypothetical protein